MFPRTQRFSLRNHPRFFQTAQKLRGSFFTIFYEQTQEEFAQAACVVTKKNFPKATARNTVKRQVRALLSPLLRAAQHKALVVVVFQAIETSDQKKELQVVAQRVLQK